MDPNEALRKIRELSQSAQRGVDVRRSERELRWTFEELDGWLTRGGFLPEEWQRQQQTAVKPALPLCTGCGLPLLTADDGTVFVYGTGTTADGLSYCPPDPDSETDDTHTFPVGYDDRAWQARQSGLDAL